MSQQERKAYRAISDARVRYEKAPKSMRRGCQRRRAAKQSNSRASRRLAKLAIGEWK